MKESELFKKKAVALGLCDKFQMEWNMDSDINGLLDKFVKYPYWCLDKHFPTEEDLQFHAKDLMPSHNIFCRTEGELDNPLTAIFIYGAKGSVEYDYFGIGSVWVGSGSDVNVIARDYADVTIHIFDNDSRVSVSNRGNAKVKVYRHQGEVITNGNVKVI